jgi:hypothetical protein
LTVLPHVDIEHVEDSVLVVPSEYTVTNVHAPPTLQLGASAASTLPPKMFYNSSLDKFFIIFVFIN